MKKGNSISIRWKVMFLTMVIVLVSVGVGGVVLIGHMIQLKEESLAERAMMTGKTVAQIPQVIEHIEKKEGWRIIQPIVERIRIIHHADYIVVMNMNRVRYAHPSDWKVGTVSKGEDEAAAFAEHTYTSKAKGVEGVAVRAFVPIMNERHEQVGVVVVGQLLPSVWDLFKEIRYEIALTIVIVLGCGLLASLWFASHVKKQMFQLEPHEIARLLVERTAAFHAMHEGVIAIDKHERITIINEKAKQMMQIVGDVVGKPIREVIPDTRLPEILLTKQSVFQQEIIVGNQLIVSNRVPIEVDGEVVGAVAIFQDRTEVANMAEELTGVRAFVEALRVQNHEYMNKLHTIAGLIQLDKAEEALKFVFEETEEQTALLRFVRSNINDESIAGLLLSKVSRARELGIFLMIDTNSRLLHFPPRLDRHDFVILLGNLIENAFDACQASGKEEQLVEMYIGEHHEQLYIVIEDNGIGMTEDVQKYMLDYGFTTKSGSHRGVGMYLIANILKKSNGQMDIDSKINIGTTITITFPIQTKGETV
jgi:two-component system, CitB family, sensor histidine kinase DctS